MLPTPPLEYPRVSLGGQEYELRFNFRVQYRASKAGIDLRKLGDFAGTFAAHMDVFALIVAPSFEAAGKMPPTADEWAEQVESYEHFTRIAKAVQKAYAIYTKTLPAETAPSPQEPANTGTVLN